MRKLLVICGPTATGKTALAVECAARLGGEIVSCDAFQIYRGLDIGTAKPTQSERRGIVHHMIDVADPEEAFSVSDFERMALPAVEDILSRGKTPVLCGGTGFYLNAILYRHSYGDAPASEEIRAKYAALFEAEGRHALHARLAAVDPESAERLHENDVKRVIRALEIYELTGRKKSAQNDGDIARYPFCAVSFDYPREELYRRIDARVRGMVAAGLFEEVRALLRRGVPAAAQSMQAIGYKEVAEFLENGADLSTMPDVISRIAQNTRNYAKRQITFFKRTQGLVLLAPTTIERAAEETLNEYAR